MEAAKQVHNKFVSACIVMMLTTAMLSQSTLIGEERQ